MYLVVITERTYGQILLSDKEGNNTSINDIKTKDYENYVIQHWITAAELATVVSASLGVSSTRAPHLRMDYRVTVVPLDHILLKYIGKVKLKNFIFSLDNQNKPATLVTQETIELLNNDSQQ